MVKEQLKTIRAALVAFAAGQAQAHGRHARGALQGGHAPKGGLGSLLVADVDAEEGEVARGTSMSGGAAASHSRGRRHAAGVGLTGSLGSVGSLASSGGATGPRAGDSNSSGGGRAFELATAAAGGAAVPVAVAWYSDGSQELLGLQVWSGCG